MVNKIIIKRYEKGHFRVFVDENRIVRCERQKDVGKELLDFIIEQYPNTYRTKMKKNFLTKSEVKKRSQPKQYIRLCNNLYVSMADNFKTFQKTFVNLGKKLNIEIEFIDLSK